MLLSIFLPGIRTEKWMRLYNSIYKSFSKDFELIICGPNKPSDEFLQSPNAKWIYDAGNPVRCQQIALLATQGEYVYIGADDGYFLDNSLDKCFDLLKSGYKDVILTKYTESDNPSPDMYGDQYWYIKNHNAIKDLSYCDTNWSGCMNLVMKRQYLIDLGGYDCRFETVAFGCLDNTFRVQRDGANCILAPHIVLHCDHGQSDHGPMEDAFSQNDVPLLRNIYNSVDSINRVVIDINNWQNQPETWHRRRKG